MARPKGNAGPPRRILTGIGEVDPDNPFPVELWGGSTGFSGQRIYEMEPRVAVDYVYNYSNPRFVTETTANGGSVTPENHAATLATSTANNGSARIESTTHVRYTPPVPGYCTFSGFFAAGVANSYQAAGIGNPNDGYGFGYNGATFGVFRLKDGTYSWTPQTSFTIDKLDGTGKTGITLDPTKGNLYMVEYQWHGYGSIRYFVQDPTYGTWALFHVEEYTNANTEVSSALGSLPAFAEIANTGNTSDLSMQVVALSAGTMGKTNPSTALKNGYSARKTGVTTQVPVFTLRNKSTFNSLSHGVGIFFDSLDILVETGNRDIKVEMIRGATLGGTPSWSDIDATSVIEVDTSATTVTGGYVERVFLAEGSGAFDRELQGRQIDLAHEETMSFVVTQVSGAGTTDLQIAANWEELW